jgi:hypothetical protein
MTIHSFFQHLQYKRKALGRHGVHSPFVYSFVEDVLLDTDNSLADSIASADNYAQQGHYGQLVSRIKAYYKYKSLIKIPPAADFKPEGTFQLLLFKAGDKPEWLTELNRYGHLATNDGMAILPGIHTTARHTDEWDKCCASPMATLSIDLYGMGLLLFNKDFKEKQHFLLKY